MAVQTYSRNDTYKLVEEVIYREDDEGRWIALPSPCCDAQMARPLLRTAICLGCGNPVDLWEFFAD